VDDIAEGGLLIFKQCDHGAQRLNLLTHSKRPRRVETGA
jgi:hypothetical protein